MKDKNTNPLAASLLTLSGMVIVGLFFSNLRRKLCSKPKNSFGNPNKGDLIIDQKISRETLVGHYEGEEDRILVRIKTKPLDGASIDNIVGRATITETLNDNGKYKTFSAVVPIENLDVTFHTIYPATSHDFKKFSEQKYLKFVETAEMHREITLPYIKSLRADSDDWIKTIVSGETEADRVLFRDDDPSAGFVLVPDEFFDPAKTSPAMIHVLAFPVRQDLRSVRSLTAQSLPLLKNILENGYKAIANRFGLTREEIYSFVHYLPGYFYFHVHFFNVKRQDQISNMLRGSLAEVVIQNLEMDSEYYQKAEMVVSLGEKRDARLIEGFRGKKKE